MTNILKLPAILSIFLVIENRIGGQGGQGALSIITTDIAKNNFHHKKVIL